MGDFEKAVEHLKSINGLFEFDLGIVRDGFVDLEKRLHALEASVRQTELSNMRFGGKSK